MNLEQLKAKFEELTKQIADLQALAESENRELTDEEAAQVDEWLAEYDDVKAQIAQAERRQRMGAAVSQGNDYLNGSTGRRSQPNQPGTRPTEGNTSRVYVTRDREEVDRMCGYRSAAEFALDVRAACASGSVANERLTQAVREAHIQIYGAPPAGLVHHESAGQDGFLVPPQMRQEVYDLMFDNSFVLGLTMPEPTMSNHVTSNVDESTPWSTTGVQAKWRAEGTQMTASRLLEKPRIVELNEIYAFVLATDELLEDQPRLSSRLTRKAGEALAYELDDSVIYGNGVGRPQGFMLSAALISVAKEGSQAADTIVAGNIAKMFSRLYEPAGQGNRTAWLYTPEAFAQLLLLTIGDQPMFIPPGRIADEPNDGFLFGRRAYASDHNATLGDQGDIMLANFAGYEAYQKTGGLQSDVSMHLYFDYGINAFRWKWRFGGQPLLSAAITPHRSTNTRSHFVTLDERA